MGAGGAGFPAHVKAAAKAETVIMNAAECEPLLHKDIEILEHFTSEALRGLDLMRRAAGASEAVIGVKRKHADTLKKVETEAKKFDGMRVHPLGDFYPAGDEYCLVYEVTRKLIPAGGIPLDVGVVVSNVETLLNAARAADGLPVTHTFLTVCGAVKRAVTLRLPVGVTFSEAVELAGGAAVEDPVAIDGGPMMGKVITDFSQPVTKTSAGIIVLSRRHPLAVKKAAGRPVYSRIGRSACDQCSYCTMLCPRYLLGYNVEPHKVMRTLVFADKDRKLLNESALLCCECSLCSLYSCPEDLDPRNMCASAKSDLRQAGISLKNSAVAKRASFGLHPVREYRKIPVSKLIIRLGLEQYKKEAPLDLKEYSPASVRLLLSQHIGVPAQPVVKEGQRVRAGELVADIPADKLGAPVHASISGTVSEINSEYIEIQKRRGLYACD